MYQHRFTFLCAEEEKENLKKLADYYRRSQSDVIRLLIRAAVLDLSDILKDKIKNQKGKENEQLSTKS